MSLFKIDDCLVCEPVDNILNAISDLGFSILESKLEDYHFHQFYFKVDAPVEILNGLKIDKFSFRENILICNCHWSRIEFVASQAPLDL